MADSTGTLLRFLRLETAEEHARLEQHPLVRPLQSSGLERADYIRFLQVFHGYYQALESRLEPALSRFEAHLPENYRFVSRSQALAGDLKDLGEALSDGGLPQPCLPGMETPAELLGILYVVEGSTLGGRMLAPRIMQQLALAPGHATGYFHLYEKADWPLLRRWLDARQPKTDLAAMSEAARNTFRTLHDYSDHGVVGAVVG